MGQRLKKLEKKGLFTNTTTMCSVVTHGIFYRKPFLNLLQALKWWGLQHCHSSGRGMLVSDHCDRVTPTQKGGAGSVLKVEQGEQKTSHCHTLKSSSLLPGFRGEEVFRFYAPHIWNKMWFWTDLARGVNTLFFKSGLLPLLPQICSYQNSCILYFKCNLTFFFILFNK